MENTLQLDEIDSTSIYARKNLTDLGDLWAVSADYQTKSYGQFERVWYSSKEQGGNCYISIVAKPENIAHLGELTQYASMQVIQVLREYGLDAKMKYPNDVLINGKKIAGILAESVFVGNNFRGAIVGIGVNLNLSEDEIQNIDIPATSIFIETHCNVNKTEFMTKLLETFRGNYEEFIEKGIDENLKGEILCQEI